MIEARFQLRNVTRALERRAAGVAETTSEAVTVQVKKMEGYLEGLTSEFQEEYKALSDKQPGYEERAKAMLKVFADAGPSGSGGSTRGQIRFPRFRSGVPISWISPVAGFRTADRKSVGRFRCFGSARFVGGPWRTRTSDLLIKSHFGQGSIGHHHAEYAAITRPPGFSPLPLVAVA
jgi:hypothetical protein